MNIVSIELIKAHCRIDSDIEDVLLELYAESAEETVLNYLNSSIESLYEKFGKIPNAIIQATLMLVEHSYTQRSPVSQTNLYTVPYTFDALVKPYMIL